MNDEERMKEERDPLHQGLTESSICRNNALASQGRVPCLVFSHHDMCLNNSKRSRPDHVYLQEALQLKTVCSVNSSWEGRKPGICPSLLDRKMMTAPHCRFAIGENSPRAYIPPGSWQQWFPKRIPCNMISDNSWLTYMQSLNVSYFTSICEVITSVLLIVSLQTVNLFYLSIKIHQVFKGCFNTAFLRGSGKSVYNSDKEKLSSSYLIPWSRAKTSDCWLAWNCAELGIAT